MRLLLSLGVLVSFATWSAVSDDRPRYFVKHGETWPIHYVKLVDNDPTNNAMTFCAGKRVDVTVRHWRDGTGQIASA